MARFAAHWIVVLVVAAVECQYGIVNSPKRLRVTSALKSPSVVQNATTGAGSGLALDILALLAAEAGFEYDVILPLQGSSGNQQPDGSWSGSVGQLLDQKADVALALAVTSTYEKVIDFITPYAKSKVTALINKKDDPNTVNYIVVNSFLPAILASSTDSKVTKVWANIKATNGLVNSTADAQAKVLAGGYAYITLDSTAKAFADAHPDTAAVGNDDFLELFESFGVQTGSGLREQLSLAMEIINEKGLLRSLLAKYGLV